MGNKTSICCLPVAGKENPYQNLMIEGLNKSENLRAFNGMNDRFLGILRSAAKYRPDYIHFDWIASYYYRRHRWMTILSLILFISQVLIAKKFFKVQFVWTLHNILPHDSNEISYHRLAQRFLAKNVLWVRVFSQNTIEKACTELKIPEDKIRVVAEGSYVNYYPNSSDRAEAREYLTLPSTAKVLLYVGLIKPYKGILELANYLSQRQVPNLYLIIAGKSLDPQYLKQLQDVRSEHILLREGFVSEEKLHYFYNAADVVILPFKNIENSGSVILAMGFKKAIIAPMLGALPYRLNCQHQLLFKDSIEPALNNFLAMSDMQIHEIGDCNFKALEKHTWADFAKLFFAK